MSKAKSKLTAIISVAVAICACFALVGCNNKSYLIEDAEAIARERFGCKKILWIAQAVYYDNILGSKVPIEGGYYVVGEDKDGNEVCVFVPKNKSDKAAIAAFDWPLAYSFSTIAKLYTEYGYEYAGGIEGHEEEYFYQHYSIYIGLLGSDNTVKTRLKAFGDADELYEKLDVKIMLDFHRKTDEFGMCYYYLFQEDGLLKMYKVTNNDFENFTVTTFGEDDINALK